MGNRAKFGENLRVGDNTNKKVFPREAQKTVTNRRRRLREGMDPKRGSRGGNKKSSEKGQQMMETGSLLLSSLSVETDDCINSGDNSDKQQRGRKKTTYFGGTRL